ncbi:MAG: hypothetical protein WBW59_17920 [Pseudolabrys sp.]
MSDSEIADANPRRDDESEDQWIARCRLVKAEMLLQEWIDSGELVDLKNGNVIERKYFAQWMRKRNVNRSSNCLPTGQRGCDGK